GRLADTTIAPAPTSTPECGASAAAIRARPRRRCFALVARLAPPRGAAHDAPPMSQLDLSRRRGCGCLGCLPQLLGLAVILALLYFGVTAIVAPWIYNVGGRWRLLPT